MSNFENSAIFIINLNIYIEVCKMYAQRSASVPDSQLSPSSFNPGSGSSGSGTILNSGGPQISPSQRQPYSPLSHQQAYSPVK